MPVVKTTTETFEQDVVLHHGFVLVDFWAEWCGPCNAMNPILDSLADQYGDNLKIVKVNIDEEPELGKQYSINSIPTMLLINNAEIVTRIPGAKPRGALDALLSSHVIL